MILSCNSCDKKFVVPDKAISAGGRLVQCGSCGNKWKQFPVKKEISKSIVEKQVKPREAIKNSKTKKKKAKKSREINLYSPEYLSKKHGISLKDPDKSSPEKKVSFGFYNYLILYFVTIVALSKGLHFFQDVIIQKFPFTEYYLNYFFESIRNVFEIWNNLISNY